MSKTQKSWLFLILAIVTEVIGTNALKWFEADILRYFFMAVFIATSYYFMGLAVKKISISVAYAMWEALGIILITLIGIFVFNETLSFYQKLGICLSIIGIILINFGEKH